MMPEPIPAELLADPVTLARMARLIGQRALRAAELAADAARLAALTGTGGRSGRYPGRV